MRSGVIRVAPSGGYAGPPVGGMRSSSPTQGGEERPGELEEQLNREREERENAEKDAAVTMDTD